MPKYYHPDVLDNGLQFILDSVNSNNVDMLLIDSYSQGQAYSTVNGNAVMSIDLVLGDFTLGNQGTFGRELVVAEKAGTASGDAPSPDLHVAIVDVTDSKVLVVTDETGDADVSTSQPITIPTFDIRMNQPV